MADEPVRYRVLFPDVCLEQLREIAREAGGALTGLSRTPRIVVPHLSTLTSPLHRSVRPLQRAADQAAGHRRPRRHG